MTHDQVADKAMRTAAARASENRHWAEMNGPVNVRKMTPEELEEWRNSRRAIHSPFTNRPAEETTMNDG